MPEGYRPALTGSMDMNDWEAFSKKITLGYYADGGEWVPGVLEQMREMNTNMAALNKRTEASEARSRSMDRWTVRIILVIVVAQFIGIDNIIKLTHILR